jgi:uncharacterized protein (TIGR02679 family)
MSKDSTLDLVKLQRRLGGDELRALRERMRSHFERGTEDSDNGTLNLNRLTAAEYEAVALLLGLGSRASKSLRIEVAKFDAALNHAGMASSLREALEAIDGPLVNRAAVRAATNARWAAVRRAGERPPVLATWLATPTASATLKRVARQDADTADGLLGQVEAVLHHLPARGLTRAQLAADALGSAHALDGGEPVATLVLAVLRHAVREKIPEPALLPRTDDTQDAEKPAERARDIWALSGVLVNELARPALHLNLPALQPPGAPGEPGYLSLRQLLRSRIPWSVAARFVFVCENPNIVAIAADRLGAACSPLVCTEGMPSAAQRVLLTQLAEAGAMLRYHGDFDWAGIHIANYVMRSFGALPWRFGAMDYLEAASSMSRKERDLDVTAVAATWDSSLAEHMRHHGLAIEEEAVAASLMEDLRNDTRPIPRSG